MKYSEVVLKAMMEMELAFEQGQTIDFDVYITLGNKVNEVCAPHPSEVKGVELALTRAWQATFEAISLMQDLTHRGIQFDEYPLDIDIAGDWGLSMSQMFEGFPTSSSYDFAGVPEPTPEPQPAGPSLPFEVFHTQEFNESAAWEAVVALSRGA